METWKHGIVIQAHKLRVGIKAFDSIPRWVMKCNIPSFHCSIIPIVSEANNVLAFCVFLCDSVANQA
jgi:predicted ester cyclase